MIIYGFFTKGAAVMCKNEIKKEIDEISLAIRVRDAFATPAPITYIPTDPTQLIIDEKKRRMISYFAGYDVAELSDYELFYELVSNLDAMSGCAEKELFIEEIKSLYGDGALDDIQNPMELWRRLCDKMSQEKCNFNKKIAEISNYSKLNNISIFANIDNFSKYSDFVSDRVKEIKESDVEYAMCDISVLNFARTDDFHASLAYEKYRAGDGEAKDEALSGALYPILSALKSAGKTLLLNIGNNYSAAERMIEYFKARDILPGTVIFARNVARMSAERLCGVYNGARGEYSILSGVLLYDGDTVRDIKCRVLDIAAAYPIGKLFIGGAMTDSPLVSARHAILKRGVAEAIYELSDNREERIRLAELMSK